MSYTFSVSYQNNVKKVTCKPSASVNQLVALSLEKFKLAPATNGLLTHGPKTLDGLTPIRLAGLVNNAKLVLKTSSGPYEATLKLVGSVDGTSVTKVMKLPSDVTLRLLTEKLLTDLVLDPSLVERSVELSVMRHVVRSSQPEFESMTVGSLVGSASNAVVRINIENEASAMGKQAHIEEVARINENSGKIQSNPASFRGLSPPTSAQEESTENARIAPEIGQNTTNVANSEPNEKVEFKSNHEETLSRNTPLARPQSELKEVATPAKSTKSQTNDLKQDNPVTSYSSPENLQDPRLSAPKDDVWSLPQEVDDTVYVPSTKPIAYENPAEDYELTSNQAEKYYKILKSMQTRAPAKKPTRKPQKYTIRIRFPDRTLLDLHFENPHTKVGQLLRKIDAYLLDTHVGGYRLKNGLPPFEQISFGFDENNIFLSDHPQFQVEKTLLIWESLSGSLEPYLKPELQRKDVNELPTVLLDQHRGSLEADEESSKAAKKNPVSSNSDGSKSKARAKGMPKWFRP